MIVRRGLCRTVLLVGDWAVKVPRLRRGDDRSLAGAMWGLSRGLQANLSEREWSDVEGVAPVLWSLGGIVNVYPRATEFTGDLTDEQYEQLALPGRWFPRDRKAANIGWLRGRLVWLDYDGSWNGCPHDRNAAALTMDED